MRSSANIGFQHWEWDCHLELESLRAEMHVYCVCVVVFEGVCAARVCLLTWMTALQNSREFRNWTRAGICCQSSLWRQCQSSAVTSNLVGRDESRPLSPVASTYQRGSGEAPINDTVKVVVFPSCLSTREGPLSECEL